MNSAYRGRKSVFGPNILDDVVEPRLLKNFDFTLLFAALAIVVYGCVMIYSASRGGRVGAGYVERQAIWALLGLVGAAIIASIDHAIFHRYAGQALRSYPHPASLCPQGGSLIEGRAAMDRGGGIPNPTL